MNRADLLIIGASALSTAVGVTAGYILAEKKLKTKYELIAEEEIAEARKFYSAVKKEQFPTPEDAVKALVPEEERMTEEEIRMATPPTPKAAAKALTNYQGMFTGSAEPIGQVTSLKETAEGLEVAVEIDKDKLPAQEVDVTVETTSNIFVDGKPLNAAEWDEEAERDSRRNGVPYVISRDEFDINENDLEQNTLTYFIEDDTLVDERDQMIDDVERLVGTDNLKRFGHGSRDNNVVYVRNEALETDFEIVKSNGRYAEEVLGFVQHSEPRGVRRFRDTDD